MAIALAAIAAVAVYMFQTAGNEKTPTQAGATVPTATSIPTVAVLIASQDIGVNTTITQSMVELKQVLPADKNARALTSADAAIGMVTTSAISQGEQVLNSRVTDSSAASSLGDTFAYNVPAGKRALSLMFDEVIGAGALVQPGDHVDVIGFFDLHVKQIDLSPGSRSGSSNDSSDNADKSDNTQDTNNNNYDQPVASYIVQDVEVLAVAQALSPDDAGTADGGAEPTPTPQPTASNPSENTATGEPVARPKAISVTLAVDPDQAQRLLLAAQTVKNEKGSLRLSLRTPGDTTIYALPPAQLGEIPLGGLLGNVNQAMLPSDLMITNAEFKRTVLSSGEVLEFKVTVKNVSVDKTIKSDKSVPGEYTYNQSDAYDTLGFFGKNGTYRLGLNVSGAYPTQYPYRWDLGHDLKPGESVDIAGSVKLSQTTPDTRYWFGVIREPDLATQDGVGVTDITVLPAAAAVVKDLTAKLRSKPTAKATVSNQLKQNDYLTVLETRGDWFRVQGPDNVEGWIEASAVQVVAPADNEVPAAATPTGA